MRLLAAALGLPLLLLLVAPMADAQGMGCTPCQCGFPYCVDGQHYFLVMGQPEVPRLVAANQSFTATWTLAPPPDVTAPGPNGTWPPTVAWLDASRQPFGGYHPRDANSTPQQQVPVPSTVNATLSLPAGLWWLRPAYGNEYMDGPAITILVSDPLPLDTATRPEPTSHKDPIPQPASAPSALLAVAGAALASRRWLR